MMEERQQQPRQPDTARVVKIILLAAVLVLALLFVLQNDQSVEVSFVFTTVDVALVWALLIALALGFVAGWLTKSFRTRD